MYKCEHCGMFFQTPTEFYEADTGFREYRCPHCGDDHFEDAHECPICGELTTGDFCDDCYQQVNETLSRLKDEMRMTQDQLEDIVSNNFGW